jgi:ribosome biogenesis GTPase A
MNFQWYPGHMTKAKRQMQEDIKLVDLVIELADARIPLSSRNPDIDELGKNKYRLILLNKSDLADAAATDRWSTFFRQKGYFVVALDARKKNGMKTITDIVMEACKEKIERDRKRGSRTARSARWWSESRMSASPHLSIPTPEKRVQRPEINRASRRENSGSA